MPKFCSLFSSSSGNSTFLATAKTRILIDAGVSCKRLCDALNSRKIDPSSIDAVFVTHDHSDHISGIRVLCSRYSIPIYATAGTIRGLDRCGALNGSFEAYEIKPGRPIELGDMIINCAETPHDRDGSCCFQVELDDGRSAAIATDLGHVTAEIHDMIKQSDLVLIESNHDRRMLMAGPYPFELKQRVADPERGHLSNEQCAKECAELFKNGKTTRFFLGHLSEHNNFPDLAFTTTEQALKEVGAKIGRDCLLEVCRPVGTGRIIGF